ncbi:MAG: TlpA family protein disulfide reductase [Candidatus Azobacteroides sp.]|nr:TlpA family protein disulfide reductase [Candidatus Azobacteroides sp.]
MSKKIFFVCFLSCICFVSYSQENKTNIIQLDLETNDYIELILRIQCHNKPNPDYDMYINGFRNDNFWTFTYPDSLYDKSFSFTIQEPTHIDTLTRYISFKYICNNDTIAGPESLSFANKGTTTINATYLQTDTFPNILTREKNGNFIFKTNLVDFYLLTSYRDKELLSSIEAIRSSFFWYDADSSRYDTEMDKYINLVKKYPDSHFLIEMLNSCSYIFKSKEDVQKLFDCFSQDNKNSYYGKRINQYLMDNHFKNSILKAWDTGESEAIVIDSLKYNLIIFSASWCAPCIEEIPVLKKIYEDLSDKLDMTYVSIDELNTVDKWQQLMKKENIPWRSVLAVDNINNIRERYYVPGVPYCLFVHTGGFMEPIDVRSTTELNYLYKTVQKGKN